MGRRHASEMSQGSKNIVVSQKKKMLAEPDAT